MPRRITAASVSLLILLAAVLTACGGENAPAPAGETAALTEPTVTEAAETEAETAPASVVPDQDLGGYNYVILERVAAANIVENEGDRTEMDGEILNDA
ncbi:MAG: hypothetical protein K6D94_09640, partial [Clostridiales bacterium]|nr:hypothetical protein [Clostridiales bacterium]